MNRVDVVHLVNDLVDVDLDVDLVDVELVDVGPFPRAASILKKN